MRFSVIIPTYNRQKRLLRCLEALRAQTFQPSEFEVIVVDDGSTDGTATALAGVSFPFRFEVVQVSNGGAGRARNTGAGSASGEFLAFTEDDVVPEREWLTKADRALSANPALDLLEGETVYEESAEAVRRMDVPGIPSFIPCNLFVRRSAFAESPGYDPAFFDGASGLYFREDADLGFTLLERGARPGIAPGILVTHPRQFTRFADALRHVRRYTFDPLLYRKHPRLFRRMIEVKRIAGLSFRRPMHMAALLYGIGLAWLLWSCFFAPAGAWLGPAVLMVLCAFAFRVKYQGREALAVHRVGETLGFLVLPAIYLWTVFRGAIRYRSYGVLLP